VDPGDHTDREQVAEIIRRHEQQESGW